MDNRTTLLHLSLINGVGPALIAKLSALVPNNNVSVVYGYSKAELMRLGLAETQAQLIFQGLQRTQLLEKECELIEKEQIRFITLADEQYPQRLKEIHLPPAVVYYKGAPLTEENALAVIGSRKANSYGQRVINTLVPELVDQGWTIVSGGAIGADTMAHRAAVKAGGKTVAVLGSGLLRPYPSSNIRLFDDIVAHDGTLVSAFPVQTQAMPGNFPARNRVIAGLSRGCLVAQAAQRSGAAITALFALEQGREVFAVPGPVDDSLSVGCHRLIQQGAKLVINLDDIMQEFGHVAVKSAPGKKENVMPEKNVPENQLLALCQSPKSIDELVLHTQKDLSVLHDELFELQLSGSITQEVSGLWRAL